MLAAALLTIGIILFALSTDVREQVLKPGPLAYNHAQILAEVSGTQRCATCHESAHGGMKAWLASIVWQPSSGQTQSQLCLECHRDSIHTDLALVAHNISADRLLALSEKQGGSKVSENSVPGNIASEHSVSEHIACASCHREHNGAEFDLTSISNSACQACHTERYHSFADDHPDFSMWPFVRRTQIVFDHASHSGKHFPEKKTAFDCATCHVADAAGASQLTLGYEQTCASCHDEQMTASIGPGIALFSLPTIDVDALADAGFQAGDWPEWATGEFDGRISPMMKLLLASDPAAAEAMETLGVDFEFADIDPDDPQQLAASATLVASIKELFAELSGQGPVAAIHRAQSLELIQPTDDSGLLLAGLSQETLQTALRSWLPKLPPNTDSEREEEIASPRQLTQPRVLSPAGSWTIDDKTFSLRYRPAGHADPLLTTWLTAMTQNERTSSDPLFRQVVKELTKPTAPGMCATCHSVDRDTAGKLAMHWQALNKSHAPRSFTRFDHGPHLIQPALRDCTYCHEIDKTASTSVSYTDHNPHTFESDFLPMSKTQCANCHTKTAAGDKCQSCHQYHVGE